MATTPTARERAVSHVAFLVRVTSHPSLTNVEREHYAAATRHAVAAYVDSLGPSRRDSYLTVIDELLDAANTENEIRYFPEIMTMELDARKAVRS